MSNSTTHDAGPLPSFLVAKNRKPEILKAEAPALAAKAPVKVTPRFKAPLKASKKPSPVRPVKVTKVIEGKVLVAERAEKRRLEALAAKVPAPKAKLELVKAGKTPGARGIEAAKRDAAERKAKAAKPAKAAKAASGEFRGKRATLHGLLTRKGGATYGEIKKRCEWPGGCKGEMNSMARKLGRALKPGNGEGDNQSFTL